MNIKKQIIYPSIGLLAILAGVFCFWSVWFGETDKAIVMRRFSELADALEKSGDESILIEMEHAKAAERLFDDVTVVDMEKIKKAKMLRKHIRENTMMLRKNVKSLKLTFYDITLDFNERQDICKVNFTCMVNMKYGVNESYRDVREMKAKLVKKDKKWLFQYLAFREVLKK